MPILPNLRLLLSVTSVGTVTTVLFTSPTLRGDLSRLFSPRDHPVRFLALAIALLLNVKNLPLVWHIRLFRHMAYQVRLNKAPLPPRALFRPAVTSNMYTPLQECDYNGHKSNSTYFSDLDMSRGQFITCLLREGIRKAKQPGRAGTTLQDATGGRPPPPPGARFMVALGAVSCHFKREIKPYERYEIWTRVLSWDRKWIYLVSHIVRAGVARPAEFVLQPGRRRRVRGAAGPPATEQTEKWKKAVFATSVSKYVVKQGRLTIPAETVLADCELLPPRPVENGSGDGEVAGEKGEEDEGWTWEDVERERQWGLKYAEAFGSLDELHSEFPRAGEEENGRIEVMGAWKDLMW